ncbi:MAG: hypothetical protein ACI3ZQ_09150 [Candidatus Cryptobacteroides sp.]
MYKISRLALLARNDRKVVGREDQTVAISGMKKPLFVPESLKTAISGTKQPVFMPELSSSPPVIPSEAQPCHSERPQGVERTRDLVHIAKMSEFHYLCKFKSQCLENETIFQNIPVAAVRHWRTRRLRLQRKQ